MHHVVDNWGMKVGILELMAFFVLMLAMAAPREQIVFNQVQLILFTLFKIKNKRIMTPTAIYIEKQFLYKNKNLKDSQKKYPKHRVPAQTCQLLYHNHILQSQLQDLVSRMT